MRASESTKVLEVVPFPSEPLVKKGDMETFQELRLLSIARFADPG